MNTLNEIIGNAKIKNLQKENPCAYHLSDTEFDTYNRMRHSRCKKYNCCIPQLWVALGQCSTIHDNALTMDFMITLATTKSDYYLGPSETWDNIFKNGPSDICGRASFRKF